MSLTPRQPSQAERIKRLEQRLRRLETRRTLGNSTISEGDLAVTSGGAFRVIDTDGHVVAIIGALPSAYNRTDGSSQPGWMLRREDNTLAMLLADANPGTPPYQQALQWFDRAGRVVVADDTNGGNGLAKPYVSGGIVWADTNTTTWPATTNSAWTTIATGNYLVQNPRLQWDVWTQADGATTGQFRMKINGTQVGSTASITGNFGLFSAVQVALPAGIQIGDKVAVAIDAQRTAGTGTVRAIPLWFAGDQSP